jgi:hypothetical protein
MNKSVKWDYIFQANQELLDQYEKLRSEALENSKMNSSSCLPGFSILLFRGMVRWIEACLSSELLQTSLCQPKPTSGDQFLESTLLPYPINKEVTMILTNMVLSHQSKPRNNYA